MKQTMIVTTRSTEQTEQLGAQIAARTAPGTVLALDGDLGAGKTAFSRGFVHAMGYAGRVTSPTFALVNEYPTPQGLICHFDLYRIESEDALYEIGWQDYLDGRRILLVEWGRRVPDAMPAHTVWLTLAYTPREDERRITIEGMTPFEIAFT